MWNTKQNNQKTQHLPFLLLFLLLLSETLPSSASRCEPISVAECQDMPYTHTDLTTVQGVSSQEDARLQLAIVEAKLQFEPDCSLDLRAFLCGAFLPKCDIEAPGEVVLPCSSTCQSVRRGCQPVLQRWGFSWPRELSCSSFPVKGEEDCMDLLSGDSLNPLPEVPMGTCQPMKSLHIPHCRSMQYHHLRLPSFAGHERLIDAELEIQTFASLLYIGCSPALPAFLCSFYFPMCGADVSYPIGPCVSTCEAAKAGCQPIFDEFGLEWPKQLECSRFATGDDPSQVCIGPDGSTSS